MSNTLFITCKHHPTQGESFRLASRADNCSYSNSSALLEQSALQKWLERHAACGGTFDHFTASYAEVKDNDLPTPVAEAVHATLVAVK